MGGLKLSVYLYFPSDKWPQTVSVSAVFVTKVDPNYSQPWQMCPQRSSSGSAFVVDTVKRHILTNSHVVGVGP